MPVSTKSKKHALVDKKIDIFCQSSASLLESIYNRCSNTDKAVKPGKSKRGRKRKNINPEHAF